MDVRRGIVRRKPAIWHGGDRIGEASIPQKVISRMLNQEAVVRDVDRLSHIHANRPARLVGCVPLAAVKHIEPVHAFRTRLRPARAGQEEHCDGGNNHAHFFHGTTSNNHMRAFVARLQSVRFSTRAKIKTTQAEACATGTAPDELASNMRKATQNFPEILVGSAVYFSGPPGHCALPPLQSPATCSGSPFPATSTLIPAGSRMDQPYLLSAAGL